MLTAIRNWVIKTMMKGQTGVVQTLPKREIIELNTQITAERMLRNGINPNDMKTVGQVENVVKQIDTPKVNVNPGVTGVKKADVLDMEGNKIPEGSGIMGGKEVKPINELQNYTKSKEEIVQDLVDRKFGKGYFDTVDESDAAIKARIEADNEKGIASMKKKLEDPEEKADGGRIGLLAGSVPKVLKLLKNKKRVQQAVDDIFPTGDYKYDAQMAADALVENNPKTFGGKLYEDLDMDTQMEVYGAVLQPITNNMAKQMQLKRATKPEKTLQSMKEGKGIDMSDPGISEEFTRFMKETDPEGYKKLEQTVELSNFKTKGRKENSDGGRIGLKGAGFINFLKRFKIKQSGDDVKDFLSKRQFMKDIVGNTEKNRKARQLAEIKRAMTDVEGYKFPEVKKEDIEKKIAPILLKDRKLNSDGGRIGLKGGGRDFEMSNADKEFEAYKNYLMNEGMIQGDKKLKEQMEQHKKKLMEKRYGIAVADGGRIGLKAGSVDKIRRLFLKAMGAGTAGIAAAKSGIFSGLGKGAGKTVAKEVAQQTTSSMPPPYFFKLAEKIKNMGSDVTSTSERTISKSLKSKDGKSEYLLEQDVSTGDTIIKKINKEGDDMITDVEIMDFRKGEDVITKDGKAIKSPDVYEEVTEANARIEGDVFNDPYYTDGIEVDEIIKEVDDKVPSIKYASGGLAYMLGE